MAAIDPPREEQLIADSTIHDDWPRSQDDTWALMREWIEQAAGAGERFGLRNLLVAALASDRGARTWARDADFARMGRRGLMALYEPRLLAG